MFQDMTEEEDVTTKTEGRRKEPTIISTPQNCIRSWQERNYTEVSCASSSNCFHIRQCFDYKNLSSP